MNSKLLIFKHRIFLYRIFDIAYIWLGEMICKTLIVASELQTIVMRRVILLIIVTIFSSSSSQVSNSSRNVDYIIYGIYCGECVGHCATMFKLDNKQLLVDTTDSFFKNNQQVKFSKDTLPSHYFTEARILKERIPNFLLQTKETKFGIPDEYDQCGIYLQISIDAHIRTFHIDTDLKSIPEEIREYASLIMKISRL